MRAGLISLSVLALTTVPFARADSARTIEAMVRSSSREVRMKAYVRLLPATPGGATRLTALLPAVRIEVSLAIARQLAAARAAAGRFVGTYDRWDRTGENARRLVELSVAVKTKAAAARIAAGQAKALYDQVASAAKPLSAALARLEQGTEHLKEIDTVAPQVGLRYAMSDHSMAAVDALLGGTSRLAEAVVRLNRWKRLRQIADLCEKHNAGASVRKDAGSAALLAATNRYRLRLGLMPLIWNATLARAAAGHSGEMYRLRYVSHTSPTAGRKTPADRIRAAGYGGHLSVGENIAGGFTRADAVFAGFCRSPAHHRNLVDAAYREIGIGRAGDKWAMNFGAPLRSPWAAVRPIILSWPTTRPVNRLNGANPQ